MPSRFRPISTVAPPRLLGAPVQETIRRLNTPEPARNLWGLSDRTVRRAAERTRHKERAKGITRTGDLNP